MSKMYGIVISWKKIHKPPHNTKEECDIAHWRMVPSLCEDLDFTKEYAERFCRDNEIARVFSVDIVHEVVGKNVKKIEE